MVLVVANTTRQLDKSLLEAAQTLGANRRQLIFKVILPGAMPNIFNDLRVLLALSWTILIIAEVTGNKSGISAFIDQQGRYRQYDNVFAAILIIGMAGLCIDQMLALLRPHLFPWVGGNVSPRQRMIGAILLWPILAPLRLASFAYQESQKRSAATDEQIRN